jgi:cytoskeletal protein CcmA (bactofilin family)
MAESRPEYGTILGPDAKFKVDLSFDSAAKMLGHIEGSIKSKGKVLIADGCKCRASVTAKEVAIEGFVEGNVEATERVEIMANGRISGDIVAARMTMGDGAAIEGHVRIGMEGTDPSKAKSATEPKLAAAPQPVKAK